MHANLHPGIRRVEARAQFLEAPCLAHYITIEIALMRELTGSVWGISVLDVDERADAPPAWLTNPWDIESWQRAMRRALPDALSAMPNPRYNSQ